MTSKGERNKKRMKERLIVKVEVKVKKKGLIKWINYCDRSTHSTSKEKATKKRIKEENNQESHEREETETNK